jgi:signal peptidase I
MNRDIFVSDHEVVRITGESEFQDSKVLLTISNVLGEQTVLITPDEIIPSKAKMFVQTPKERIVTGSQKTGRNLTTGVKYVGYVLSAILITFSLVSTTGLVKARIVLTGSMAPTINPGDIVLLAKPTQLVPHVGSIVAYTARRFDGNPVGIFTHRIIGGDATSGFIVKGDANPTPDVQHPRIADISGVQFFTVPYVGKILTPKMLIILVPVLVGFWFISDALKSES